MELQEVIDYARRQYKTDLEKYRDLVKDYLMIG